MSEIQGAAAGKKGWPDARSLGWPPEGVEAKPAAEGGDPAVTPFELAPDPGGSGTMVAVAVGKAPEAPAAAAVGAETVARILEELGELRRAVEALSAEFRSLRESAGARGAPAGALVPARIVSDNQARQEIQEYFLRHSGQTLFPAQIAEALDLPVLKVAELCESLALRGAVRRDAAS